LSATVLALLLSGEQLASLSRWWPWSGGGTPAGFAHADKITHAALFAACGYCLVMGWLTRTAQLLPLYLALLVLGGGTEWLQAQIPGRGADAWDLVADAVGAALGITLALHNFRRSPPC
jgi:VanZ family protein